MIDFVPSRSDVRILFSYFYFKKRNLDDVLHETFGDNLPPIIADSGAFSAFTQGKSVDVHEYADWLAKWKHLFTHYINLDVIHDLPASDRNMKILESKGLKPMPVFHGGEPIEALEEMCDQYPYIALGGVATGSDQGAPHITRWFIRAFEMAQGKSVYHALGMTYWPWLRDFPWYSVDSSSWLSAHRYGTFHMMHPKRGLISMMAKHFHKWNGWESRLRAIGFTKADVALSLGRDQAIANGVSGMSFLQAQHWLRQTHGPIAHPTGSVEGDGLHLYLAASVLSTYSNLCKAIDRVQEQRSYIMKGV